MHAALNDQLCFALYAASRAVAGAYRPMLAEIDFTYPTQYLTMLAVFKGLPEAIEAVWPQAVTPHLLRASFRYAARQHWDALAKTLRPVCTAPTEDAALERFVEFEAARGRKYPAITKLSNSAWTEFVPFLDFGVEFRRVICTANAIESINARIRRAVRAQDHFRGW